MGELRFLGSKWRITRNLFGPFHSSAISLPLALSPFSDGCPPFQPASVSNNGSATSPRSRPRSPWTTDESSDLEAHVDSTESSWLASIKEKATIQYPITPESSLVCAKEEPPHLDSSIAGPDGLPKDIVSRTVSCIHDQILNLVHSMWRSIQLHWE